MRKAVEEEPVAEEEPGADLSTLRWAVKDTLVEGVTFYGRIAPEGWVLDARRLAGVPVRFSLAEPQRFAGFGALVGGLLAPDRTWYMGADRRPLQQGDAIPTVGEHPLYASQDPQEGPRGIFRKTSREEFELEVPWKTAFSAWQAGKPIL